MLESTRMELQSSNILLRQEPIRAATRANMPGGLTKHGLGVPQTKMSTVAGFLWVVANGNQVRF
jgi:hypothetical protein